MLHRYEKCHVYRSSGRISMTAAPGCMNTILVRAAPCGEMNSRQRANSLAVCSSALSRSSLSNMLLSLNFTISKLSEYSSISLAYSGSSSLLSLTTIVRRPSEVSTLYRSVTAARIIFTNCLGMNLQLEMGEIKYFAKCTLPYSMFTRLNFFGCMS